MRNVRRLNQNTFGVCNRLNGNRRCAALNPAEDCREGGVGRVMLGLLMATFINAADRYFTRNRPPEEFS